jgi:hypothetical protein
MKRHTSRSGVGVKCALHGTEIIQCIWGIKTEEDEITVPELSMDYCFGRCEEEDDVVTVCVL